MKRLRSLCLVLVLLLLCGCTQNVGKSGQVTLYYRSTDEDFFSEHGIMAAEERNLSWNQTSLSGLLSLYFQGPSDSSLVSPFPEDTQLVGVETTLDTVTLTLNDSFAELSTVALRVAAGCIARTVWDYNHAYTTVIVRTVSMPLGGQEKLVLYPQELVLKEDGMGQGNCKICVYFADAKNRYLIGEERTVAAQDSAQLPMLILNALMEGPGDGSLGSVIPPETKLLGASVRDHTCEVHFSGEFLENCPEAPLAQRMTLFSIVNSLCQLEQIDSVKLYADGTRVERYGIFDLSQPLTADTSMIGPIQDGAGAFDADIYLCIGAEVYDFPMCLHESVDLSQPEAVLRVLTDFAERNGYRSPLPENTKLEKVQRDGTSLSVYFDAALLAQADETEQALILASIVRSLKSLDRVKYVHIFVDGTEVIPNKEAS